MRGKAFTRGAQERGSGVFGVVHGAIHPVGGRGQCNTIPTRLKAEDSDAIITSIIPIYFRSVFVLFYWGSIFSYVSIYFSLVFDSPSKPLTMPIFVSTLVRDSLMVDRVYRSCIITFVGHKTQLDLLVLGMVDFDFILVGIGYQPFIDYYAKTMTIALPGVQSITWKGALYQGHKRVISYIPSHRLVLEGLLSYLDNIGDTSFTSPPTLDLVYTVHHFMDVLPTNLLGMPLDYDIDIFIYVKLITKSICIPLYRIDSRVKGSKV